MEAGEGDSTGRSSISREKTSKQSTTNTEHAPAHRRVASDADDGVGDRVDDDESDADAGVNAGAGADCVGGGESEGKSVLCASVHRLSPSLSAALLRVLTKAASL